MYRLKSTVGLDGHSVDWFPLQTFPQRTFVSGAQVGLLVLLKAIFIYDTEIFAAMTRRADTFALDLSISWHWPPAHAAIRQTYSPRCSTPYPLPVKIRFRCCLTYPYPALTQRTLPRKHSAVLTCRVFRTAQQVKSNWTVRFNVNYTAYSNVHTAASTRL